MITPGLVSVTFRGLSVREICVLCVRAGLRAVEWGGDVHVPPEGRAARETREMSADFGLEICAYGSYYRVGNRGDSFERWLDAASELGTKLVRVWCGSSGSRDTDASERKRVVEDLVRCCAAAHERGMTVAPEFHGGTLTDTSESTRMLLDETRGVEGLKFYWQPRWDLPCGERLDALQMLKPRLACAHVFTWRHTPDVQRLGLAEGEDMWKRALPLLDGHPALLEFVRGDDPEQLVEDARTLRGWIADAHYGV